MERRNNKWTCWLAKQSAMQFAAESGQVQYVIERATTLVVVDLGNLIIFGGKIIYTVLPSGSYHRHEHLSPGVPASKQGRV